VSKEDNLIPFKPGQSGNPKGRPKGAKGLTSLLREALERSETVEDENGNKTQVKTSEVIIAKLLDMAKKGNQKSIQEIFDRIEGKPKQEIDHSGSIPVETEVVVNVVRDEKKKPKN